MKLILKANKHIEEMINICLRLPKFLEVQLSFLK